jgi:hypothetical protein
MKSHLLKSKFLQFLCTERFLPVTLRAMLSTVVWRVRFEFANWARPIGLLTRSPATPSGLFYDAIAEAESVQITNGLVHQLKRLVLRLAKQLVALIIKLSDLIKYLVHFSSSSITLLFKDGYATKIAYVKTMTSANGCRD